jgi:hypothetical protein
MVRAETARRTGWLRWVGPAVALGVLIAPGYADDALGTSRVPTSRAGPQQGIAAPSTAEIAPSDGSATGSPAAGSKGGFRWRAINRRNQSGVWYPHRKGRGWHSPTVNAAALNNQIRNSAGVALGDVDGDGGAMYLSTDPANALFHNLGNWRFADVTAEPASPAGQYSTGGSR